DPVARALNDGDNAGDRPLGLDEGRQRALGGAGRLWAGQCLRLTDADFEPRPWVPHSGWPIAASELRPYYDRAEDFFHVRGEASPEAATLYARAGLDPLAIDPTCLRHTASVYAPVFDVKRLCRAEVATSRSVRLILNATVTRLLRAPSGTAVAAA